MNYLIAWLLCISSTVLTILGGFTDLHWLLMGDANVTIYLAVAYFIEKLRAPPVLKVRASSVTIENPKQIDIN